jgi:hypothetical protein
VLLRPALVTTTIISGLALLAALLVQLLKLSYTVKVILENQWDPCILLLISRGEYHAAKM